MVGSGEDRKCHVGLRIRSTFHTSGAWDSAFSAGCFLSALPIARPSVWGQVQVPPGAKMLLLMLLALLWGGSPAQDLGFSLQVQRVVMVQEGLCVRVPCTLSYPPIGWMEDTPALGYWFLAGTDSSVGRPVATNDQNRAVRTVPQDRFQLVGDPQKWSCSLLIKEAQMEDSAPYFFRVERGRHVQYNFLKNQFYLQVTDAPKDLVISVSWANTSALEPPAHSPHLEAEKGQFLRLHCAADSQPPATLSWALEDRVLLKSHPQGSGPLELVLPGVKPADSGCYTCRAENRLGSQSRTLDLSVQYAPENLRVMTLHANRTVLENLRNGTSLPVLEGQSLRLLCVTHSNPPARLSWVLGGQTLSPFQLADPGILELPQIQMEHEGDLTCQAQNPLGSQHVSLRLSVVYPPRLLSPSCSWEGEGLHCSCSSRAQPAPTLRWRLGEGLLEGNHSNASWTITSSSAGPWANSSLSLSGPLGSGLRLSCEAQNAHGKQSAALLLLPDKGLISKAFANGTFLGIGIMTLLFLCLLLVVKTLKEKQTQAGTPPRPRATRRSTILDYINVFPNPGPLAQNRKATPSSPSQAPPPGAHSLEFKKNQKELHVAHTCPRPKSFTQASESENNQEELHYATLHFSGLRPWEPKDTYSEYADIKFH
ncbi:sialic acid-binding Ig-like lectin 10 isoform X2 [Callorhinus ursinus]|uniref:sialic acid-binding Ig-like lectin 10 isoform X2 n=1 Tax=Callorhinus ursinus TaxID=34884 RepID=UPI003CD0030E